MSFLGRVGGVCVLALLLMLLWGGGVALASLQGPCEAKGSIEGTEYNAKQLPPVVEIPREGVVPYTGTHTEADPDIEREYSGGIVQILLPLGLFEPTGPVTTEAELVDSQTVLASWGGGKTKTVTKKDSYPYEIDERIPAGVEFTVAGLAFDSAGNCSGSGTFVIKGKGKFDDAAKGATSFLTALFGGGLVYGARAKRG